MAESFLTFHTFGDEETGSEFADIISAAGIEYRLEKIPQILDNNIIGTSSAPPFVLKLLPSDFEKANLFLENYYKKIAKSVSPNYYLFSFSDKELMEILEKQDEWSYLDCQLAQQILADRGHAVSFVSLQHYKQERIKELSRPEKGGWGLLFFSGFLVLAGFISCISIFMGTTNYFPACLLISMFLSFHLSGDKKVLPDGQTVFAYNENVRRYGKMLGVLSVLILVISVAAFLYFSMNQ